MTAKTKTNFLILFFLCLTAALTISACAALGSKSPDGDPVEQAMQTLQAQATQDYYATLISQVNAQATEIAGEAPTAQPNEPTNVVDFPVLTQAPPTENTGPNRCDGGADQYRLFHQHRCQPRCSPRPISRRQPRQNPATSLLYQRCDHP